MYSFVKQQIYSIIWIREWIQMLKILKLCILYASILLLSPNKMQMYYNNINAAFPYKSIQRHVFEKNLHERNQKSYVSRRKKRTKKCWCIRQSHKNKKGNREWQSATWRTHKQKNTTDKLVHPVHSIYPLKIR